MRSPLLKTSLSHNARSVPYDRELLQRFTEVAIPHCLTLAKKNKAELAALTGVEISILGSRAMAKVHRDFLNIPGATDVITFPYGEILVCAHIAGARAPEFGHSTTAELALYIIHGLLHLSGFDDISEPDAKIMAATQQEILKLVLSEVR